MQTTKFLTTIALLVAVIGTPLMAGAGERDKRPARQEVSAKRVIGGFDHGIQPVVHSTSAEAPGHGWRYFTDPVARRAVVISPQGNYYYSNGKGLRWIAAELT